MGSLTRSFALGLAAGGRSSVAITVPVAVATRDRHGFAAVALRTVGRLAVLGELIGDKLPTTPSRLDRPVLLARVVAGAVGGVGLALAEHRSVPSILLAAPAGASGAYVGSFAGATWRRWAAEEGPSWVRPDTRAALLEDGLVLATSARLIGSAPRGEG
jgi:uncharacterized membrane protein